MEADTPAEAAELAGEDGDLGWKQHGVVAFGAALYVALDAEGNQIDGIGAGKLAWPKYG